MSFIEDGYFYICKRDDDDYVLAKNSDGSNSYNLPRISDSQYSFSEAEDYYNDNPSMRFVEKAASPSQRELLEAELETLLSWFDWYDQQCMQYQRSQRMQAQWDGDIESLDTEAVTKSARIVMIRTELDIL